MNALPKLTRRQVWERRGEWPLTAVAFVFMAAYAWPILDPTVGEGWLQVCSAATWGTWGVFCVDYLARLTLSTNRWRFVYTNVLDLAVVILPLVRPLRLLRLVTLLRVLQRSAAPALRGRVGVYAAGSSALLVFVAALAVLDAERSADEPNISEFGDALWWAVTTVTTVGYGDRYPTSGSGRLIAVGLMLAGIALLGVITATLASWFVELVNETSRATRSEVEQLATEISQLRALLLETRAPTSRPADSSVDFVPGKSV